VFSHSGVAAKPAAEMSSAMAADPVFEALGLQQVESGTMAGAPGQQALNGAAYPPFYPWTSPAWCMYYAQAAQAAAAAAASGLYGAQLEPQNASGLQLPDVLPAEARGIPPNSVAVGSKPRPEQHPEVPAAPASWETSAPATPARAAGSRSGASPGLADLLSPPSSRSGMDSVTPPRIKVSLMAETPPPKLRCDAPEFVPQGMEGLVAQSAPAAATTPAKASPFLESRTQMLRMRLKMNEGDLKDSPLKFGTVDRTCFVSDPLGNDSERDSLTGEGKGRPGGHAAGDAPEAGGPPNIGGKGPTPVPVAGEAAQSQEASEESPVRQGKGATRSRIRAQATATRAAASPGAQVGGAVQAGAPSPVQRRPRGDRRRTEAQAGFQ